MNLHRMATIRRQIEAGEYLTQERLRVAVGRMLDDVLWSSSFQRVGAAGVTTGGPNHTLPPVVLGQGSYRRWWPNV